MEIDQSSNELSQEKVVKQRYESLITKASELIQRFKVPNRNLMLDTLECSNECYSTKELSLVESHNCQENCEKNIKYVDFKTQVAFGRFDSMLNGCLHSCTKQRRKSSVLSGDVANCYSECLNSGEKMIMNLDTHLSSLYSKFTKLS